MTSRHRSVLGTVLAAVAAGTVVVGAPVATATDATICVGVVVDPTGSGSTRPADQTCVTVPQGASGIDVLNARADALNRTRPRIKGGEVCAIDGQPTSGCGESDGNGGFRYWSYWHQAPGASSWSYSSDGAGSSYPANGSLEGWSFQDGGTEHGRQPPPAAFSDVCPEAAASPTPAPTAAAPSPTAVAPTGVRTTAVAAPSAGGRTSAGHRTSGPALASAAASPKAAARTLSASAVPLSVAASGSPSAEPASASPDAEATDASAAPAVADSGGDAAAPSLVVATRDPVRSRSSSGPPWVAIAAIVLALGLGGAATARARRR